MSTTTHSTPAVRDRPPIVFMFPGQSSAVAGLFATARSVDPGGTEALLDQASSVLGRNIERYVAEDGLASNHCVQVAVFVCNHLHLSALEGLGLRASLSLGLSLGEYNHLVHIGALSFAEALRLVDARGRAYDSGPDGVMAAVFPVTREELEPILLAARTKGFVALSNANGPSQQVIAGERAAVEEALRLLEEDFVQGRVIEEHIPMHTERFRPVAETFRPVLQKAPWKPPALPYLPNTTAELIMDAEAQSFVERLTEHVWRPVRWQESIERLLLLHPEAAFVEVGPRTVLHDLLRRTWVGRVERHHTADPGALRAAVEALG